MKTTFPENVLIASTIGLAQLLPLSELTVTGKLANWTAGGLRISSSQLLVLPSRSRTMNEPPPVLQSGTMYSWPSGFLSTSGPSGLLICQLISPDVGLTAKVPS